MPRRNPPRSGYIVKYRNNGHLRGRQFDDARSHEQAVDRMNSGERVLSVRKLSSDDIMEREFKFIRQRLNSIIGIGVAQRQSDAILDNMTLDSIVFPNMVMGRSRKGHPKRRRFSNGARQAEVGEEGRE